MCLNLLVKDFGGHEMNVKKNEHSVSEVIFFLLMSKRTHSLELYNRAPNQTLLRAVESPCLI